MRYKELFEQELDEIVRTPADDHGDDAIRQGIRTAVNSNRKLLANVGTVRITWGQAAGGRPGQIDVVFVEDDLALGYALLEKATRGNVVGYFVTEIGLRPKLQGRGIGSKFYEILLRKGMTLFSGMQHTPDGERMWRNLMKRQDVTVFVCDDNGPVKVDPQRAWDHPDYILAAYSQ